MHASAAGHRREKRDFAGVLDRVGNVALVLEGRLPKAQRADRVREILAAFLDPAFDGFPRRRAIRFAAAAGMTRYSDALAPLIALGAKMAGELSNSPAAPAIATSIWPPASICRL